MQNMKTKQGKIRWARIMVLALLLSTILIPASFAGAETTSGWSLSGITKVSVFQDSDSGLEDVQYALPDGSRFVFIKQGKVTEGLCVLWSETLLTLEQKQAILDYVIDQPGASDDGATLSNVRFFYGYGTFSVFPRHGSSYSYSFAGGEDGTTVLTFDRDRISHIFFGTYVTGPDAL